MIGIIGWAAGLVGAALREGAALSLAEHALRRRRATS
jgi:hypothetical protein